MEAQSSVQVQSQIMGFLFRHKIPETALLDGLAAEFGVDPREVGLLDVERKQQQVVVVECHYRQRGFLTDVTVYLDWDRVPNRNRELTVASSLARRFDQEVLIAPPLSLGAIARSPGSWLLHRPSGEIFIVDEEEPGDDGVVVNEDPSRMVKLEAPEVPS